MVVHSEYSVSSDPLTMNFEFDQDPSCRSEFESSNICEVIVPYPV